jgi:hypothetical protein
MNPSTAQSRSACRGLLLLAFGMVIAAWAAYHDPTPPSSRGRGSWLAGWAYTAFGSSGISALWLIGAALILVVARFIWRHTPKLPSDRLLW